MQTDPEKYSLSKTIKFTRYNGIDVSTVFMGLDHNHGNGRAILFETMVFYDKSIEEQQSLEYYNQYQCRYYTYDEAIEGHREICTKLHIPEEYINGIKGDKVIKDVNDLY
jgi:hypothetical protein